VNRALAIAPEQEKTMWDDLKEGELARFHDTGKLYGDEKDD
jgi:hypothetical protein